MKVILVFLMFSWTLKITSMFEFTELNSFYVLISSKVLLISAHLKNLHLLHLSWQFLELTSQTMIWSWLISNRIKKFLRNNNQASKIRRIKRSHSRYHQKTKLPKERIRQIRQLVPPVLQTPNILTQLNSIGQRLLKVKMFSTRLVLNRAILKLTLIWIKSTELRKKKLSKLIPLIHACSWWVLNKNGKLPYKL